MEDFSLRSWLPYLLLIVQLHVLPWMLNVLIVQLCTQPLLFHTILRVFFQYHFEEFIKITFLKVFLFHDPPPSWDHQPAEGRAVSAILTSMYSQYAVVRRIFLEGTGGFRVEGDLSCNLRCTPEFGQQAVVYWTCFTRVWNCQKFCKLIVKKRHH